MRIAAHIWIVYLLLSCHPALCDLSRAIRLWDAGKASLARGEYDGALGSLNAAVSSSRDDPETLGVIYGSLGDTYAAKAAHCTGGDRAKLTESARKAYNDAIECLDAFRDRMRARRETDREARAALWLGASYHRKSGILDDPSEKNEVSVKAMAHYEKYLELEPRGNSVDLTRAFIADLHLASVQRALDKGELDLASELIDRVLASVPGDAELVGRAYLFRGDVLEARRSNGEDVAGDPDRQHPYDLAMAKLALAAEIASQRGDDQRKSEAAFWRGLAFERKAKLIPDGADEVRLAEKKELVGMAVGKLEYGLKLDTRGKYTLQARRQASDNCLWLGTAARQAGEYDECIRLLNKAQQFTDAGGEQYLEVAYQRAICLIEKGVHADRETRGKCFALARQELAAITDGPRAEGARGQEQNIAGLESEKALVRFEGAPAGATVIVDRVAVGKLPCELPVWMGLDLQRTIHVEVRHPEHDSKSSTITVASGSTVTEKFELPRVRVEKPPVWGALPPG